MKFSTEKPLESLTEVEAVLLEMERIEQKRKKLGEQLKKAQKLVTDYMTVNQMTLFATDKYQASLTCSVSKRFDTMKFKAEHEKLYRKYLMEIPVERFTYRTVKKA